LKEKKLEKKIKIKDRKGILKRITEIEKNKKKRKYALQIS